MNGELFVPQNLLDVCVGMQEAVASAPPDEQDRAGADACEVIGENVSYYGANRLEVRTLGAYMLPDDLTLESQIWPKVSFGEMRLKGELAQVGYARVGQIKSLVWMMVNTVIRSSASGHSPGAMINHGEKDRLRRPLYVPVGMIESVLIAA